MTKKKKRGRQQPLLSPQKYVVTRARNLPVYKCFINKNWHSTRQATIAVLRKHVNNRITAGLYRVDMLSYGLTDTSYVYILIHPDPSFS
jgi:hypothetical protein